MFLVIYHDIALAIHTQRNDDPLLRKATTFIKSKNPLTEIETLPSQKQIGHGPKEAHQTVKTNNEQTKPIVSASLSSKSRASTNVQRHQIHLSNRFDALASCPIMCS